MALHSPVKTDAAASLADPDATEIAGAYLKQLAELAARVDIPAVGDLAQAVADTIVGGRTVMVAGNGGSASTAGHIACDIVGTCLRAGLPHARVLGLSDNPSVLTALANDIGFAEVFAQQIRLHGSAGDLLLLLSVSGESANLIAAARAARAAGIRVAVAVGRSDASLLAYADHSVCLDTTDYGLAEDLQLAMNHIVGRLLSGGSPQLCTPAPLHTQRREASCVA